MDFLRDNEILYNKHLMDYKYRSKREAVWAKFCEENNLDKDACQKWFQSQHTIFGKVTHMNSGQGEPLLTERQKYFLRDNIVRHLTAKSEFRAPKGSASPFQDTSCYDPSDISHLDTHTPTTRSRAVSVVSCLADSDLQAALAKSQRGITKLKDNVVKKFEDKPDNPNLGFCDFLKLEVEQLTSDSYDEFQQETFKLFDET